MTTEQGGWITSAILMIGGVAKYVFDYRKRQSDNETSIKLNETNQYKQSREELDAINKELMQKLSSLEDNVKTQQHKLDKMLSGFEIIFPLIETMIKDKPEYQKTFDVALKHFKECQ